MRTLGRQFDFIYSQSLFPSALQFFFILLCRCRCRSKILDQHFSFVACFSPFLLGPIENSVVMILKIQAVKHKYFEKIFIVHKIHSICDCVDEHANTTFSQQDNCSAFTDMKLFSSRNTSRLNYELNYHLDVPPTKYKKEHLLNGTKSIPVSYQPV